MKQQISALVLVLVFLAGLGIPAMAAGEKLEKIPQITVTIPDSNDFQITFTNAGSLYSLYDESDGQRITFFCYNDTTVMFNKAVTLSYGLNGSPRTIKAGESIDFFSLTDGDPDISFSGKSKSLFIMFMPAGSESGFSNLMPLANLAPADPNAPSDWASAEIESAIAAGLVPET
ncbi:MAG: hypothetical protein LBL15_05895, partial [Oscillospiraceae bacterium]|nr:hypothetical protein [Oscillospiraceae bacterium]